MAQAPETRERPGETILLVGQEASLRRYAYHEAVAMMRAERGSHFDPRVLDAFLGAEEEIRAIMALTGA